MCLPPIKISILSRWQLKRNVLFLVSKFRKNAIDDHPGIPVNAKLASIDRSFRRVCKTRQGFRNSKNLPAAGWDLNSLANRPLLYKQVHLPFGIIICWK